MGFEMAAPVQYDVLINLPRGGKAVRWRVTMVGGELEGVVLWNYDKGYCIHRFNPLTGDLFNGTWDIDNHDRAVEYYYDR